MHMSQENGQNQIVPQTEATPVAESERKLGLSMLMRLALAVVVVTSLVISISCVMHHNQMEAEKAELEAKLADCNQDIAEMQYLINAPVDKNYVARIARERLNMYYPDEVIYYSDINP